MYFDIREWERDPEPEPEPSFDTHCGLCGDLQHKTPESLDACLLMEFRMSIHITDGMNVKWIEAVIDS